jgi:hypothetical protein
VSVPLQSKTSLASMMPGSEDSDSDDTRSFRSAIDYFDELGLI